MLCEAMLLCGVLAQAELNAQERCQFVAWWANKAYHISHTIGLAEDRWMITEDGFTKEGYALIMQIKHEAYHDVPALRRRVESACADEQES